MPRRRSKPPGNKQSNTTTNTQFKKKNGYQQSSRATELNEVSAKKITYNSQGKSKPRKKVNTGAQGTSVKKNKLGNKFQPTEDIDSGSQRSSKENTTSAAVQKTETTTPTQLEKITRIEPSITATIRNVVNTQQKVKSIPTSNSEKMQTAINITKSHLTNIAKKENPKILRFRSNPSLNTSLIAKKISFEINKLGKSKEEGNKTLVNTDFFNKAKEKAKLKKEEAQFGSQFSNNIFSSAKINQDTRTADGELILLPTRKTGKKLTLSNASIESSSTNNTISIKAAEFATAALAPVPAPALAPVLASAPQKEPKIGNQLFKKNTSTRANRRRTAREKQQAAKTYFNELPLKNTENLETMAQKQGFNFQKKGGILVQSTGFRKTKARNIRKSKKTMKKLKFNTEQRQILERKIKKAEEAAKSSPSFLSKVLGGLGFYPGDGRDPNQYIQELQSKIQELDSTIAQRESLLKNQLETATNNKIRGNIRAEQKAIVQSKHYRDLLSKYIMGETTGKIKVPEIQMNTANIQATMQKIDKNKKKKTNILANRSNERAEGLGENMQRLFINTAATKKTIGNSSANTPAIRTETTVEPLFPKINITAKNTKRRATANAMKGKDPYALLGLDPTKMQVADFNLTVRDTFDKLLRAKKSKNISNENHDKKLGELRQARDFLLNSELRTGFNSRVRAKINPNTTPRSNT